MIALLIILTIGLIFGIKAAGLALLAWCVILLIDAAL